MALDPILGLALAGGAVVAVKVLGDHDGDAPPVKTASSVGGSISAGVADLKAKLKTAGLVVAPQSTYQAGLPKTTGLTAAAEKQVMAAAKKEWDTLSAGAKKAACDKLKKAYPTSAAIQALPCTGSYDQIIKGIAAAGGTAACAATGAGVAVSPLCGVAAAWIADWAGPKFKTWATAGYDAAKDAVVSGAKAVVSGAKAVIPFW